MRWTQEQLDEALAKQNVQPDLDLVDIPDQGLESKLMAKCIKHCDEQGWPCWHDRSRRRNQPGWPDLFIFQPEGRLKLIETKAAKGVFSKDQQALHRTLAWLGHKVHQVRSYKRYLDVVYEDMGGE